MTIRVPERGTTNVSSDVLGTLSQAPEFWSLVDAGILSVSLLPSGGAVLAGGPFVGRSLCGETLVEVVEKIPGALRSLLSYASGSAFRIEPLRGARTELGPLIALLVTAFLTSARAYLTSGKEFVYSRERDHGPVVAGRIVVSATALARARGLTHHIAFDRTILTHDTEKNLIVQRALREIEAISRVVEITAGDVTQARALAMYFEDFASAWTRSRDDLARSAERLSTQGQGEELLPLAALLLRHESFEHADWLGEPTPRTWFINLERLFEDALLREINRLDFAHIIASRGSGHGRSIFHPPVFDRADPDLVLHQEGGVVGVGDAKYKSWTGSPARADVYQLLVHSEAFASPVCFLAYAHDRFASAFLGHAVTGAAVHAFGLDVTDLETSVLGMLSELDAPSGA